MAITETSYIKRISAMVKNIIRITENCTFGVVSEHLYYLTTECKLTFNSWRNRKIQNEKKKENGGKSAPHIIQVSRGNIYNADITVGVGSEIKGNHLVIIIQNKNANLYSQKVNVIVIEGDGKKIKPYQLELSNHDLICGKLNKNPSRVIPTEILTIDKARLSNYIGKVKPQKMREIDLKILNQLDLKKYCKKHLIFNK